MPRPRVLQWYSGGLGVVWDEILNLHNHGELKRWMQDGKVFIIVDYETGEDVTRVFMAHGNDTQIVVPIK
jgi:hypothetical protein